MIAQVLVDRLLVEGEGAEHRSLLHRPAGVRRDEHLNAGEVVVEVQVIRIQRRQLKAEVVLELQREHRVHDDVVICAAQEIGRIRRIPAEPNRG